MIEFQRQLLRNDDEIYFAFSCGSDSVPLVHLMNNLYRGRKKIRLFYINHGYNIPYSQYCITKANEFASSLGLSLIIANNNKPLPKKSYSLESYWHSVRMDIFNNYCSNMTFVLGHHLDDVVESHMMNVLRGHEHYMPIPIETKLNNGNRLLRPFMLSSKKSINSYSDKNDLHKYIVTDPSNVDNSMMRNNLRNVILPQIYNMSPGFRKVVKKKMISYYKDISNEL